MHRFLSKVRLFWQCQTFLAFRRLRLTKAVQLAKGRSLRNVRKVWHLSRKSGFVRKVWRGQVFLAFWRAGNASIKTYQRQSEPPKTPPPTSFQQPPFNLSIEAPIFLFYPLLCYLSRYPSLFSLNNLPHPCPHPLNNLPHPCPHPTLSVCACKPPPLASQSPNPLWNIKKFQKFSYENLRWWRNQNSGEKASTRLKHNDSSSGCWGTWASSPWKYRRPLERC